MAPYARRLICSAAAAITVATGATANPFLPIGGTDDFQSFVDLGSVQTAQASKTVWVHSLSIMPKPGAPDILSASYRFQCDFDHYQVMAATRTRLHPRSVEDVPGSRTDMEPVPRGTPIAGARNAVCFDDYDRQMLVRGPGQFTQFDLLASVRKVFLKRKPPN